MLGITEVYNDDDFNLRMHCENNLLHWPDKHNTSSEIAHAHIIMIDNNTLHRTREKK